MVESTEKILAGIGIALFGVFNFIPFDEAVLLPLGVALVLEGLGEETDVGK